MMNSFFVTPSQLTGRVRRSCLFWFNVWKTSNRLMFFRSPLKAM